MGGAEVYTGDTCLNPRAAHTVNTVSKRQPVCLRNSNIRVAPPSGAHRCESYQSPDLGGIPTRVGVQCSRLLHAACHAWSVVRFPAYA